MAQPIEPDLPVVFLHAFPLHAGMWAEQAASLSDRLVLVPDLPGFGGSPAAEATLDAFARRVIDEMDAAGVERAAIVGLSMGGYVAFRLWDLAPQRIGALVLADTRAGPDTDEAAARRLEQARRAREEGTGWLPDAMIPGLLGETTRAQRPEVVEQVRRMVQGAHPEGVATALMAMRSRPDSRPLLPGIDVPVLVIVGDEDRLTPVDAASEIADAVGGARLEILEGAGHLSNLEVPGEWNRLLKSFLRGRS